jgi:hypothetical protein
MMHMMAAKSATWSYLKRAWDNVQRLRTLLESPKQRKTSKTQWFFIILEP